MSPASIAFLGSKMPVQPVAPYAVFPLGGTCASSFTSQRETANLLKAGESQPGRQNPTISGRRMPQIRRFLAKNGREAAMYVQVSRLKVAASVLWRILNSRPPCANNRKGAELKAKPAKDIMTTPLSENGGTRWYYADANNQPQGPYSIEELSWLLSARTISTATLVIKEGDAEWKPYREIFCGSHSQASLPPVPPSLPAIPQSQATFSTSQGPVMEAVGSGGSIELFQDRIRIKRKGALAFMSHGLKGDKVIFLSQITAVQFKAAGLMRGYIQFSFPGASAAERGVLQAASDENTVMFDKARQPAFEKIRKAIENYQSGGSIGIQQPLTATTSPLSANRNEKHGPSPVILLLILFWPAGLFLMWRNQVFPRPVRLFITGLFGFAGIMMLIGMSGSGGSSFASGSSSSYSVSESTPEPTPKGTPPYIVLTKREMPLEQGLALINANKGALPSDDITIARFRYLLERAVERTGDEPKAIADAACKGQGLVRENGRSVTLLNFMEGVNRFLETPGLPQVKYFDAALMVSIELSK